ncbi:uncharacterized protein LOC103953130 [Pyrus x bretschneideri]|uniref:uncharacterized protein LOC103953130 n=1 Tax=Pyrus x bretschneideri TaxID=225117 RepID=UPI00203041A4|nr:uncharacterized protein LOC103953130 [Pyrus x bretschneideri]
MLPSSPCHSFSDSLMEENIEIVKALIAMQHFLISQTISVEKLIRAQNLMQSVMKCLEKECYQILFANREYLDLKTVSNRSSKASTRTSVLDQDSESKDESVDHISWVAMFDLKSIVDCMIAFEYGKECVRIYNIIRKSIFNESLYLIGIEKMTLS